jgi:hypothetical protein
MRRLVRSGAILLLGTIVGLVLAEGLVRLYFAVAPSPRGAAYIRDKHAGYRLRPDPPAVFLKDPDNYTNSLGFRDREHPRAKPPGTYRIVGIGDSFVLANISHLSDHFLKVAEREIGRRASDSTAVEMILMGVGGYSPENEVGVLRSVALPLAPDLVVLNFFVGNDVTGIRLRGKVLAGRWYPASSPYGWLNVLRKSDLFLLAERLLLPPFRGFLLRLYLRDQDGGKRTAGDAPGTPAPPPAPAGREGGAAPAGGAAGDAASGIADTGVFPTHDASDVAARGTPSDWYLHAILKDMPVFAATPDAKTERMWQESEGCLEEFDRLCDGAGVPWILLLIPAQVQVDPELQRAVERRFSLSPAGLDLDAPQRRLHAFARARGIPVVDPLNEMRARNRPDSSLYIPDDGHWSVRGNHLAGEMLGAFVSGWRRSGR